MHTSTPQSPRTADKQRRRKLGAFYTPPEIVRYMFRCCLSDIIRRSSHEISQTLTLLDPACGDGAFLLGAGRELSGRTVAGWQGQERSAWPWSPAPDSAGPSAALLTPAPAVVLYGVDIDPEAIEVLQHRLAEVATESEPRVICGDALTGPAFNEQAQSGHRGLDWSQAFPEVAATGGFDLIIGNPPYLREKDAKQLFDRIAASPLGQRWRQPRMDLWHYFVHRGLDLLKPGGMLCFILNSYWTSATSAQRLIGRLQEEATIDRIVLLGDEPIFPGVSGRHMILQLRKGRNKTDCAVLDLSASENVLRLLGGSFNTSATAVSAVPTELELPGDSHCRHGSGTRNKRLQTGSNKLTPWQVPVNTANGSSAWFQPQSSLFDAGRLIVAPERLWISEASGAERLGESFVVRQGIAENPPFVTRTMSQDSAGTLRPGMGVFVLTADEVAAMSLAPDEQHLLRPYYVTVSMGRYSLPPEPTHWLLYLTRRTAPEISRFPAIKRHLEYFRETLKRRREVRKGSIAWWHLHWPRQEALFTEPRIIAVQMGRQPTFAYAERATFVGFSVNVVQSSADNDRRCFSLPALTAILNSQRAAEWFARHAKHRGVHLDISGTVLRDFPVPGFDAAIDEQLGQLCQRRQSISDAPTDALASRQIEIDIDRVVEALYAFPPYCDSVPI